MPIKVFTASHEHAVGALVIALVGHVERAGELHGAVLEDQNYRVQALVVLKNALGLLGVEAPERM